MVINQFMKRATGIDIKETTLWGAAMLGLASYKAATATEASVNPEPGYNVLSHISNSSKKITAEGLKAISSASSSYFFYRFETVAQSIINAFEMVFFTLPTTVKNFYTHIVAESHKLNEEIKKDNQLISEFHIIDNFVVNDNKVELESKPISLTAEEKAHSFTAPKQNYTIFGKFTNIVVNGANTALSSVPRL